MNDLMLPWTLDPDEIIRDLPIVRAKPSVHRSHKGPISRTPDGFQYISTVVSTDVLTEAVPNREAEGWDCRFWVLPQRQPDPDNATLALMVLAATEPPHCKATVTADSRQEFITPVSYFPRGINGTDSVLNSVAGAMMKARADYEMRSILPLKDVRFTYNMLNGQQSLRTGGFWRKEYFFNFNLSAYDSILEIHEYDDIGHYEEKPFYRARLPRSTRNQRLTEGITDREIAALTNGKFHRGMPGEDTAIIFRALTRYLVPVDGAWIPEPVERFIL